MTDPDRRSRIVELPTGGGATAAVLPGRLAAARTTDRVRFGEGAMIACDNLVRIYKVADLEVV
ncbi:MAG TPA: hypothetical protein VGK63_01130, partial [Candidatus Limnocylindrales bacterium]